MTKELDELRDDPVAFLKAAGFSLQPWQERTIRDVIRYGPARRVSVHPTLAAPYGRRAVEEAHDAHFGIVNRAPAMLRGEDPYAWKPCAPQCYSECDGVCAEVQRLHAEATADYHNAQAAAHAPFGLVVLFEMPALMLWSVPTAAIIGTLWMIWG